MTLDEKEFLNGRFFSLWVDNEEYAQVKTAKADSELETQKLPIAGKLGKATIIIGASGTGELGFYDIIDDDLPKKINESIKKGVPFIFNLTGEIENKSTGGTRRVIIEDCTITSFSVLDVDIEKILEKTYKFEYDPDNVDID